MTGSTMPASPVREWLFELLRCPRCSGRLNWRHAFRATCEQCAATFDVEGGVVRFAGEPDDEVSRRTQASFGYEWTHFADWQPSGETSFRDYFTGVDLESLRDATVLDAGCGMGRHARFVAPQVGRLVAADFSAAIDQAARTLTPFDNVGCIQADLRALPLAGESFDFIYSLGVLHHIADTEGAIRALVSKLKRGGTLRIYVYWAPSGWKGRLLRAATAARRITTRMPFGLLRVACWLLGVVLFVAIVLPYRALSAMGVTRHASWPLFVYTKYPFRVLYNDQFDRFSAPIEKRYTADQARRLLEAAGLEHVRVIERFGWLVEGRKPA